MDRRRFVQSSLGAAVAGPFLAHLRPEGSGGQAELAAAQAPAPAPVASPAPATRTLVLDVYSKSLHWMRTADEVAQAAVEIVCGGVCPTVQPYPGHIDPSRVAQELPAFVARVRSHGLRVTQIKGPAISDVSAPHAEAIIGAAAQAGCTHYSLGGYTYDLAKPLQPQLDAIKLRVEKFVRLNQKHQIALVYHTAPGAASVGGVVLDLLSVLKEFDPSSVGFHWDTGHMALHGDGMWETLMRLAGPYIATVGWRDRGWVQDLGLLGEGGPYTGPHPRVEPLTTLPDGSAVPRGASTAGAGREGSSGLPPGRGGGGEDDEGPPRGAPPGGGGRPLRGPANPAGAGSIDANNPFYRTVDGEMPKRPIGGKNVKGAGWSAPNVAMGMGLVHIPRVATVLAEIGFNGPSELQSEYAGIGGAETGADTITRPRQFVIGMLKRDVITIRKSFEMAGSGIAI